MVHNCNGVASTVESSPTRQGGPNYENLEIQESILSELRKTREDLSRNLRENTEAIWYLRAEIGYLSISSTIPFDKNFLTSVKYEEKRTRPIV